MSWVEYEYYRPQLIIESSQVFQPFNNFYSFIVPLFILSYLVYRIKEVSFTDGTAGATSFWDGNSSPIKGFFGHQPYWHLGPRNGPPSPLPVMIWYDFKSTGIRPAEVSYKTRLRACYLTEILMRYSFVIHPLSRKSSRGIPTYISSFLTLK